MIQSQLQMNQKILKLIEKYQEKDIYIYIQKRRQKIIDDLRLI